ncbi:hypothetical protein Caci_4009 [Catenulispora acidiphila DSM 44928]|uniref:Uncharacterized protein n=1 Tax=Catenulispora acidiphila (strain DSM 44928 / JCM 14897 / NBRC 102108 / NRRL B-24433 / ID139908) TaxID=479433 RepID=C7QEV9_CATAD|nr:hypothetical protein [Catenulispora acidiphila]ACU72879.1 hypothetical protein Caci_4009 [Catenulispora acidiphila DSM 44928]
MFEKASGEELAERQRVAAWVREELAIAGLPTVGNDEHGLHGDVNGVLVEVDEGDDTAGGVILSWACSDRLTDRIVGAVADRRFEDPAIWHAGAVRQAMNAAVVQILTAAGFTVVDNPNDMHPQSLKVTAAPGRDAPLAWENADATASSWIPES